jgi:type I restriction enzyme M protein
MRFEEFADCQGWWGNREEGERAWRVPVADLETNGFNLDLKNPNRPDDLAHRPPEDLVAELIQTEQEIMDLLSQLQVELGVQG